MGLEELGKSKAVRLMYANCEVCMKVQGGLFRLVSGAARCEAGVCNVTMAL